MRKIEANEEAVLILRFPSQQLKDRFRGQLLDGWGEVAAHLLDRARNVIEIEGFLGDEQEGQCASDTSD